MGFFWKPGLNKFCIHVNLIWNTCFFLVKVCGYRDWKRKKSGVKKRAKSKEKKLKNNVPHHIFCNSFFSISLFCLLSTCGFAFILFYSDFMRHIKFFCRRRCHKTFSSFITVPSKNFWLEPVYIFMYVYRFQTKSCVREIYSVTNSHHHYCYLWEGEQILHFIEEQKTVIKFTFIFQ